MSRIPFNSSVTNNLSKACKHSSNTSWNTNWEFSCMYIISNLSISDCALPRHVHFKILYTILITMKSKRQKITINFNWNRKDITSIYREHGQLHGINRYTKKAGTAPALQQHFTPFQCLSIDEICIWYAFASTLCPWTGPETNSFNLPSVCLHSANSAPARRQYFGPPTHPLSWAHLSSVAVINILLKTALQSPSFLPLSVTKYPDGQHRANAI